MLYCRRVISCVLSVIFFFFFNLIMQGCEEKIFSFFFLLCLDILRSRKYLEGKDIQFFFPSLYSSVLSLMFINPLQDKALKRVNEEIKSNQGYKRHQSHFYSQWKFITAHQSIKSFSMRNLQYFGFRKTRYNNTRKKRKKRPRKMTLNKLNFSKFANHR